MFWFVRSARTITMIEATIDPDNNMVTFIDREQPFGGWISISQEYVWHGTFE